MAPRPTASTELASAPTAATVAIMRLLTKSTILLECSWVDGGRRSRLLAMVLLVRAVEATAVVVASGATLAACGCCGLRGLRMVRNGGNGGGRV